MTLLGNYIHKDPSSILRAHIRKLAVMARACNPGTGEVETGRFSELNAQPA